MDQGTRKRVRQRAANRCEYCGLSQDVVALVPFHIEHVVARQHGGSDDLSNLALACHHCNLHKGPNLAGLDPDTGEMAELFHPRAQVWDDHFRLEQGHVFGQTPTGRATVRVLSMNDPRLVELRRNSDL